MKNIIEIIKDYWIEVVWFFVLGIPAIMYLVWAFSPKTNANVLIIDKTVLNDQCWEHRSVNWVLDYLKIVKSDGSFYKPQEDYKGFFPIDRPRFKALDFKGRTEAELKQQAENTDLLVMADTYGIYSNEWYNLGSINERSSRVYGGLDDEELRLMELMRQKGKVILAEWNMFSNPTADWKRDKMQQMFGFKVPGWVGRYYRSLDTLNNPDLPVWLYRGYMSQHGNKWPFNGEGYAFVNERNDKVEIISYEDHMEDPVGKIEATVRAQEEYGLPASINYPYWAEVCEAGDDIEVLAYHTLKLKPEGRKILQAAGIPERFPAVLRQRKNYAFYYFSGDFSDSRVSMFTRFFKGIHVVDWMFYPGLDPDDNLRFFWQFYRPLMSTIIEQDLKSRLTGGTKTVDYDNIMEPEPDSTKPATAPDTSKQTDMVSYRYK